jgi:hypothetical protein
LVEGSKIKIGEELTDGNVFAGIHPEGGYLFTQKHGTTKGAMTWIDAEKYCQENKGWSIPTIEELGILWAYKNKLGWYSAHYWSCDKSNENFMLTFGFGLGCIINPASAHLGVGILHKDLSEKAHVRLVIRGTGNLPC